MNRLLSCLPISSERQQSVHVPVALVGLFLATCATAFAGSAPQAAASSPVPSLASTAPRWAPAQLAKPVFPEMTSPEQIAVRDRATARWKVLLVGDFAKAYAFTTPTFRKSTTEADYLLRYNQKPQWWEAEVLTVTCATPERCVGRVRMDVKVKLPRTSMNRITTHGDETWSLEDGQWWFNEDTPK